MPLSSAENLALFPFGVGFFDGEVFSPIQSTFSDSRSDVNLPFEPYDARQPLPYTAIRLRDPYLKYDRDLAWNIDWAVAFVVDRLEQSWADAAASLRNIRLRAVTLHKNGSSQEITLQIFDKLDRLLFAGYLKNAVFHDASNLSASVSGATYTHGWERNPEVKRISIVLNREVLRNGQPRDVVAMLIHHMIYAYFLVACGGQKKKCLTGVWPMMYTLLVCLDYRHRMNTYGIMYEDPMAILKEIYRGGELDSDLQAWARKFLTRTLVLSSPACHHHNNLLSHSTMEPSNLLKLESQHSPYRSRFFDAMDSNQALEHDVNRARAELEARGWHTSPGPLVDRARNFSAHLHRIAYPSFFDSSLSSSSSSSWHNVHNLTTHLSSLHVDHTLEKERDQLHDRHRIEINYDDVEARCSSREEQCHRNVDRELDRARERVRRLERKRGSRETQPEMKVQAIALVEKL